MGPEQHEQMLDVRQAAAQAGRHPETIRRWVLSGKLTASRQGNRLRIARSELDAVAGNSMTALSLAEWAELAGTARRSAVRGASGQSAGELVLEDRASRSHGGDGRAGR